MKCAYITQSGPPENLIYGDQPTPEPESHQVLVKIGAASVNPIDTYFRAGAIPLPSEVPYIPGCDLAGTVEQVGANVVRFKKGDRVWGSNQGIAQRQGTLAEYAVVDECWLYPTPDQMSDEQAAAGALTGITAHLGLFLHGRLIAGEYLFINGGSGGVGSMAVQFAKAAGATVITTAGSEVNRQLCLDLGADEAFDYQSATLDDEIRDAAVDHGGLDLWWETQREPDIARSIGFMRKRGRIIVMAGREAKLNFPLGPFYVSDLHLCGFAIFNASDDEQRECADRMNKWFEEGLWKPVIGARFPLSEAAAAHRLQEENTLQGAKTLTGKIVVIPD